MKATSQAPRANDRATSAASTPEARGSSVEPVRSSRQPACVSAAVEASGAFGVVEIADGGRSEFLGEPNRGVFELTLLGRRSGVHRQG